jgi:hypothetical protein
VANEALKDWQRFPFCHTHILANVCPLVNREKLGKLLADSANMQNQPNANERTASKTPLGIRLTETSSRRL